MEEATLRILLSIQRQLTEFRKLQPLLDYALEASLILFAADTCSIMLLTEDRKKEYVSTQFSDEDSNEIPDRNILEWVSQTRKISPVPDESVTQAPVTIAAPLLFWGQLKGAISLTRSAEPSFTADDMELLQLFAEQLTVVIENARLNEQMTTAVITQSEILEDLEQQLQAVSNLIVHDLHEPVGVIASFASLLEEYSGTLSAEEQKLAARTIHRMAVKMNDLGVRMLNLTGQEQIKPSSETVVTQVPASMDTKPLNTIAPIT